MRRSTPGLGSNVLTTSAAGGVGYALAALLRRYRVDHIVGGLGSASKAGGLADGVIGVERGTNFFARAKDAAGGQLFDIILESIGGDVLANSLTEVASGGTVISYGAAAAQKDAVTPTPGELRTRNVSLAGSSIINLSRTVPTATRNLIESVLALTEEDLVTPVPRIVPWEDAITAHVEQANGHGTRKTVVRIN
ncbi:zinc-binding dehydrogenase [Cryobacterium sp. TMT4-31]|uniref:zinc-binding dehydrogenase n=1 Tax=Cryobacterium sp. TMT4-31 TaxID=1259259 RepID=UPI00141B7001|nr:zinc-binding dehydrogenase [Cryobacterium sp. TMT4-31]